MELGLQAPLEAVGPHNVQRARKIVFTLYQIQRTHTHP